MPFGGKIGLCGPGTRKIQPKLRPDDRSSWLVSSGNRKHHMVRTFLNSRILAAGPAMIAGLGAPAAVAQDSAVQTAEDAFGERVGIEQLGLYSESQVRGFDLQASGTYRIDGAYFSRAAPLNDSALEGVGVRVGVNAASLPYPAPSGVVIYKLRRPAPDDFISVSAGLRDFGTKVVELNGSWRAFGDQGGLSGGVVWRPDARWLTAARGRAFDAALVLDRSFGTRHRVRFFGTVYDRDYDSDDAVQPIDGKLPPIERKNRNYAPDWANTRATSYNFGALYNGRYGPWSVDLSAFRFADMAREDFTVAQAHGHGRATGVVYMTGPRTNVADSGEARVTRRLSLGSTAHFLGASLRARRSRSEFTTRMLVPLGEFELGSEPLPSSEPLWDGRRGRDVVDQVTGSVSYAFLLGSTLEARFGLHRTRYEKTILPITGAPTRGVDRQTLANASALLSVSSRVRLFGSWVTGIEESGVAPPVAANANEILPPVRAEQYEIGLRYVPLDGWTLIIAGFDLGKPTMGFRSDNSFGPVGHVRHRGIEASLTGKLAGGTRIVLGAVAFKARLTGELADAGKIGRAPPGISRSVINANVEQPLRQGWSVDAQITRQGPRYVDTLNLLRAPGYATLNVGARKTFAIGRNEAHFRMLASNITGTRSWVTNASGLLVPVAPQTIRAILTVAFDGTD